MTEGTEKAKNALWETIDNRLGLSHFAYHIPRHGNTLPYMLGGLTAGCFAILVVTGMVMAQFYDPSEKAYSSIVYLVTKVPFGGFLRSLHYWAANLSMVLLLIHLIRTFITGSYKKPRELSWLSGLALLALMLGFFFTGSVLRQDQEAVEALTHYIGVGEIMGNMGMFFTTGFSLSVAMVARTFFTHVDILVLLFVGVLAFHMYLIKFYGISPKPTLEAETGFTVGQGESTFFTHLKRLTGYTLLLFAFMGVLAILFPSPLGVPGVFGVENTKPPWPFLPFFGMEDSFGFPSIVWGPTLLFILLAIVPFIDRSPYMSPRRRIPMMIYGAIIVIVLLGFGYEGYTNKMDMSVGAAESQTHYALFAPIIPTAYAHTIPMITISPERLFPGDRLTVSADGMPGAGTYVLSIVGVTDAFTLGTVQIKQGNDFFENDYFLQNAVPPGSYLVKAVNKADKRTFYSMTTLTVLTPKPAMQVMTNTGGMQGMTGMQGTGGAPATMGAVTKQADVLQSKLTTDELTIVALVLALSALAGGALVVRTKP